MEGKRNIYYEEDEIDLYELWLVLKKRWKVIAGSVLFFSIIAVIYIYKALPLYKVVIYLSPARVENKPIQNVNYLISELKAKYQVNNQEFKKNELKNSKAYVDSISLADRKSNLIKIEILGINNKFALSKTKEVVLYLNNKYKNYLDFYKQSLINQIEKNRIELHNLQSFVIPDLIKEKNFLTKEQIPLLKRKLDLYKKRVKNIDLLISSYRKDLKNYLRTIDKLSKLTKSPNISHSAALILTTQLASYQSLAINMITRIKEKENERERIVKDIIPNIEAKIKQIQTFKIPEIDNQIQNKKKEVSLKEKYIDELVHKLKYPFLSDFKILSKEISNRPYKPKKFLILSISIISGIFIGIFIAFFQEWLENERERREKEEA